MAEQKEQTNYGNELPEYIKRIDESLKGHERTHRTLLTLCGFGLVTFSSSPDLNMLFHNGAQSYLPIVNIQLSIHSLAWLLPVIITSVYYIYLYRLRRTYSRYKKYEVDHEKTASSIFDNMIELLRKNSFSTYWESAKAVGISMYLLSIPPASLFIIYLICLKRHDDLLSFFQMTFTFASAVFFMNTMYRFSDCFRKWVLRLRFQNAHSLLNRQFSSSYLVFICFGVAYFTAIFTPKYVIQPNTNHAIHQVNLGNNSYFNNSHDLS